MRSFDDGVFEKLANRHPAELNYVNGPSSRGDSQGRPAMSCEVVVAELRQPKALSRLVVTLWNRSIVLDELRDLARRRRSNEPSFQPTKPMLDHLGCDLGVRLGHLAIRVK